MSRIGRLPVTIPSGVQVEIDGRQVTVQGPKGTLQHTVADPIEVVWHRPPDGTALSPDDPLAGLGARQQHVTLRAGPGGQDRPAEPPAVS